jgi:hypothetical protein
LARLVWVVFVLFFLLHYSVLEFLIAQTSLSKAAKNPVTAFCIPQLLSLELQTSLLSSLTPQSVYPSVYSLRSYFTNM